MEAVKQPGDEDAQFGLEVTKKSVKGPPAKTAGKTTGPTFGLEATKKPEDEDMEFGLEVTRRPAGKMAAKSKESSTTVESTPDIGGNVEENGPALLDRFLFPLYFNFLKILNCITVFKARSQKWPKFFPKSAENMNL